MHEDLDPADASIGTHQDPTRADNQNDAVGPVGWRLRQVEVHLHDEAGDQAFRDVLVVVAEAEHLRVVDAVQTGVDRIRIKRGDRPRVFSSTIGRGRESIGRTAYHWHGCF
jgi:hypothetical protein